MNSSQAKKLSLPQIMSHLGYEPTEVTKGGHEYWYCSPFRQEKEASFHTSFLGGKWIWNDFGDTGGTVIDFIMRHENFTRVSDALQFLEEMGQGHISEKKQRREPDNRNGEPNLLSFQQQGREVAIEKNAVPTLELIKVHPISNPIIHAYLQGRRIPVALADHYLEEVKYRNKGNGKEFFAFGMENRSRGYEIRAASDEYSFKSALKQRDITVIASTDVPSRTVSVFEGMIDFLSFLVLMNTETPSEDCIIMHSLSSFHRTVEYIQQQDYNTIHTYLDNNLAGLAHTEKYNQRFEGRVVSQSPLFMPHIDLNDALKANQAIALPPN